MSYSKTIVAIAICLTCLFLAEKLSAQSPQDPRYVCFDEECTANIDNASPHCHELCNSLGYSIGHCGNWSADPYPDYERRRVRRQAIVDPENNPERNAKIADLEDRIAKIGLLKSQLTAELFYKHGHACQCHRCDPEKCDAYCGTKSKENCLSLHPYGSVLDVCGCGIDTNIGDNILAIFDHLCF